MFDLNLTPKTPIDAVFYLMDVDRNVKLADVYDDDEHLQEALLILIPDFEYPDYSHKMLYDIISELGSKPGPMKNMIARHAAAY